MYRFASDGQSFGNTVVYYCDDGFEIYPNDASLLTCGADHNWGPENPPICRRVACSRPSGIDNGYFEFASSNSALVTNASENHKFRFGDKVAYKCNPGFKFKEANHTVQNFLLTCLASQSWGGVKPECKPVSCGVPPARHHGSLLPIFLNKTFVFSEVVEYSCDRGYEAKNMSNNETLTCTKTG